MTWLIAAKLNRIPVALYSGNPKDGCYKPVCEFNNYPLKEKNNDTYSSGQYKNIQRKVGGML